jgi:hypothetical protein
MAGPLSRSVIPLSERKQDWVILVAFTFFLIIAYTVDSTLLASCDALGGTRLTAVGSRSADR